METFRDWANTATWTLDPDGLYAFSASAANPPVVNYLTCIGCGSRDFDGGLWAVDNRLVCLECATEFDPDGAQLVPTDQQQAVSDQWAADGIGGN